MGFSLLPQESAELLMDFNLNHRLIFCGTLIAHFDTSIWLGGVANAEPPAELPPPSNLSEKALVPQAPPGDAHWEARPPGETSGKASAMPLPDRTWERERAKFRILRPAASNLSEYAPSQARPGIMWRFCIPIVKR
jgi:hypothetical protein